MEARIDLITIWTDDVERMKRFYNEIIGFEIEGDLGEYVEFINDGVRFAICSRSVMIGFSGGYKRRVSGQGFELAFPCSSPADVDATYESLKKKGVKFANEPQDMPWNQRTALFEDPDGNIHEIFARL